MKKEEVGMKKEEVGMKKEEAGMKKEEAGKNTLQMVLTLRNALTKRVRR
jgi:hypothetical protein